MSRLHRADDPYASDVVAYVTLRIRLSSGLSRNIRRSARPKDPRR